MKLFKKPWEKQSCTFELQEYGLSGGKGWSSITEPTGQAPTKDEAIEFFRPGGHYRVIARSVEGKEAGRFVGTVWTHYEVLVGGLKPPEKKIEPKEKKDAAKSPAQVMEEYAEGVVAQLTPLIKIGEVFKMIRESLNVGGEGQQQVQVQGNTELTIPPPEFEGKLPVWTHPFVVKQVIDALTQFVDHTADRIEGVLGGKMPGKAPEEEEEEPLLPSMKKFTERVEALQEIPIPPEPQPQQPEEEGEEEKLLPSIPKKVREVTAETTPLKPALDLGEHIKELEARGFLHSKNEPEEAKSAPEPVGLATTMNETEPKEQAEPKPKPTRRKKK